jgi:hypothetical protein
MRTRDRRLFETTLGSPRTRTHHLGPHLVRGVPAAVAHAEDLDRDGIVPRRAEGQPRALRAEGLALELVGAVIVLLLPRLRADPAGVGVLVVEQEGGGVGHAVAWRVQRYLLRAASVLFLVAPGHALDKVCGEGAE